MFSVFQWEGINTWRRRYFLGLSSVKWTLITFFSWVRILQQQWQRLLWDHFWHDLSFPLRPPKHEQSADKAAHSLSGLSGCKTSPLPGSLHTTLNWKYTPNPLATVPVKQFGHVFSFTWIWKRVQMFDYYCVCLKSIRDDIFPPFPPIVVVSQFQKDRECCDNMRR